jgi:hypothetical protein
MVANNVRIDATPEFLALISDAAQKSRVIIKVIGLWLVWPLVSTIIELESEPRFGAYSQMESFLTPDHDLRVEDDRANIERGLRSFYYDMALSSTGCVEVSL